MLFINSCCVIECVCLLGLHFVSFSNDIVVLSESISVNLCNMVVFKEVKYLFQTLSATGNVSVVGNRIFGYIRSLTASVTLKEAPEVSVNTVLLQFYTQPAALNSIIIPSLNSK